MTDETDPFRIEIIALQIAEDFGYEAVGHRIECAERPTLSIERWKWDFLRQKMATKKQNRNLIAFGHEKVQIGTGQNQFQIGFDQPQISRVSIESVDANDQVKSLGREGPQLLSHVEIRRRRIDWMNIRIQRPVKVNLTFKILLGFEEGKRTVTHHRNQLLLQELFAFAFAFRLFFLQSQHSIRIWSTKNGIENCLLL